MPELPEVETICRALKPRLEGRTVQAVVVRTEKLRLQLDETALRDCCVGRTIEQIRRRGKYLIVELSDTRALLIHLGMTGAFRVCSQDEPVRVHEHVVWDLPGNSSWRFADVRRFGSVQPCMLSAPGTDPDCLPCLGPEPLGDAFTAEYLHAACRDRKRPIKNLIMDQNVVVGVGNIYASEALFRSRIHPRRASLRLSRETCERLVAAIRDVLTEAIAHGGTTISDFRQVDGTEGKFRLRLEVYGRAGEKCPRCGTRGDIRRVVLAGRSSFYCPRCQR